MEEQHCDECNSVTQHYYYKFETRGMDSFNGWRCLVCKEKRHSEKQKIQDYRDTLHCQKCGESRKGQERGKFYYLDGKEELYTCRKCLSCSVCGNEFSYETGHIDYDHNLRSQAHIGCYRPIDPPEFRKKGNW
jgi:hypothetical protein